MQITHSSPDMAEAVGCETAFSGYIKFVSSDHSLPIFWNDQERQYLWGTSLEKHVAAKLSSLEKEYAAFCEASKDVSWSREWFGGSGCLSMHDWKVVDGMYRSRAMDFEAYGLCLVPMIDMANHAMPYAVNAMYWIEGDNKEACLYLDGWEYVEEGDEITIIYGLHKGASEMLFSYGFIDDGVEDAGAMMIGWEPPEDDELRDAKMEALNLEPGFKLYVQNRKLGIVKFAGSCVWAMSVNEEDGLRIRAAQGEEGRANLSVYFKEKEVGDKYELEILLRRDRMSEIFQLRAYSYVQARVKEELQLRQRMGETERRDKTPEEILVSDTSQRWEICERLRYLEMQLLERANEQFQSTIAWLMSRQDVNDYLAGISPRPRPAAHRWEEYPDGHAEDRREAKEAKSMELNVELQSWDPTKDGSWGGENDEDIQEAGLALGGDPYQRGGESFNQSETDRLHDITDDEWLSLARRMPLDQASEDDEEIED